MKTVYMVRRKKLGKTSCGAVEKFSTTGIKVYRNDVVLPPADLVFRWGCTSNVPCKYVVNKSEAIHLVSDKTLFRGRLDVAKLCPKTWFHLDTVEFPAIVRPQYHAQGRNLIVVNNEPQLKEAIRKVGPGWYASEIIDKVSEYRVFVVSGRAVWVASKTPADPKAIAWNVARGGKFTNVRWDDWPLKAVKVSIEAFKLSGLDFGGVDVMVDAAGKAYVLEINSAPSQTSEYRQQCMTKAFDYIVKNGKQEIPLIDERGGYRKFIHPAIAENAL
jgi:glutathione synthase/RimK-type ligase-like ATP-grasp enzyme